MKRGNKSKVTYLLVGLVDLDLTSTLSNSGVLRDPFKEGEEEEWLVKVVKIKEGYQKHNEAMRVSPQYDSNLKFNLEIESMVSILQRHHAILYGVVSCTQQCRIWCRPRISDCTRQDLREVEAKVSRLQACREGGTSCNFCTLSISTFLNLIRCPTQGETRLSCIATK
jgi:hypothetical protein